MMSFLKLLSMMFSVIMISSCSTTKWSYEKDAINLHFTGDSALNQYQKQAHSLIVCAYHLKDLNGFNQLVDEKGGLERLLECNRFDTSATYAKRLVIQPAQDMTEVLSRTEDARYLGIVAGYYSLKKEHVVRSYPIPVSWLNNPKKLYVELHMGSDGLQEIKKK